MKKLTKVQLSQLLRELIVKLEEEYKDNFTGLILFGSYAKNKANDSSDLDILITFKTLPSSRYDRTALISDFILPFKIDYKIEINALIAEEDKLIKSLLLTDINDYAKIIKDKNNKIKSLFLEIKKDYENGYIKKLIKKDYYVIQFENV